MAEFYPQVYPRVSHLKLWVESLQNFTILDSWALEDPSPPATCNLKVCFVLLWGRVSMSSDRYNCLPKLLTLYATSVITEGSAGRFFLSTSIRMYYKCLA